MNKNPALMLFLGLCAVLAILLLTAVITFLTGACIFAVALALLGGLSRGFKKVP